MIAEEAEVKPKKSLVNILKKRILAYSAIKIRANPPAPYSMLNPETNSDSPSAKSKGVRLVSAIQETNQNNIKGAAKPLIEYKSWLINISAKFKVGHKNKNLNKIKARLIS